MKRKKDIRKRLLDELREVTILPPLPPKDVLLDADVIAQHNASTRALLEQAQCIEASNVARFFEKSYATSQEAFDGFWRDLKCLAPPFPRTFVEWDAPLGITFAKRMGVLFMATKPEETQEVARRFLGDNAQATPKAIDRALSKNPAFVYLTLDFVEFENKDLRNVSGLRGPYHIGVIAVGTEGEVLDSWVSHGALHAISERESMQLAMASLVGWSTLAMMNCQNIATDLVEAPEKFQRSRTRHGKLPLVSYRTIRVDASKNPRGFVAESSGEGNQRLHQRRGHMKDYRKGKGLFGRYKGLWYWGPALAGSGAEGVVVSDYQVAVDSPVSNAQDEDR